jgi:hypothetical protein
VSTVCARMSDTAPRMPPAVANTTPCAAGGCSPPYSAPPNRLREAGHQRAMPQQVISWPGRSTGGGSSCCVGAVKGWVGSCAAAWTCAWGGGRGQGGVHSHLPGDADTHAPPAPQHGHRTDKHRTQQPAGGRVWRARTVRQAAFRWGPAGRQAGGHGGHRQRQEGGQAQLQQLHSTARRVHYKHSTPHHQHIDALCSTW